MGLCARPVSRGALLPQPSSVMAWTVCRYLTIPEKGFYYCRAQNPEGAAPAGDAIRARHLLEARSASDLRWERSRVPRKAEGTIVRERAVPGIQERERNQAVPWGERSPGRSA